MLNKIIVPLDGSPLAEQALDHVENLLAPGGQLMLLSVVEIPNDYDYALVDIPMTLVTARQYTEREYQFTLGRVQEYLGFQVKRFQKKGYAVDTIIETGDPATMINDVAEKLNVDAVVMTTHGRTGLNRFLFGSVAQKVMSHMVCPVMIIPGTVPEKTKQPIETTRTAPAT